jgi:hypothetical protein
MKHLDIYFEPNDIVMVHAQSIGQIENARFLCSKPFSARTQQPGQGWWPENNYHEPKNKTLT